MYENEDYEDTLENAMYDADFSDLIEMCKKAFPNAIEEFNAAEMLKSIFYENKVYIWLISDEEDRERYVSVSQTFRDEFEISEIVEYKDGRGYSEVYHRRVMLYWEYQLERVYEPYTLMKDWLENKYSHLLKESA